MTPKMDKLDEILESLWEERETDRKIADAVKLPRPIPMNVTAVERARLAIIQWIKEEILPKHRGDCMCNGWNDAIHCIEHNLNTLGKGSE